MGNEINNKLMDFYTKLQIHHYMIHIKFYLVQIIHQITLKQL